MRKQGKRLERAYDRFIRFARALDLRPQPIEHRLVAVVFSRIEDFSRFAARDGTPKGQKIAGYYSPAADRLVFYYVESDENVAEARERLEQLQSEIDSIRRAARRTGRTGRRDEAREISHGLDQKERQHNDQMERLNRFATQQSITVTIHEAIHQLMFHSRVQSPHVQHPLWLSEGLATAFETDAPESQFGPLREFQMRRQGFYQVLDNGGLLPLRELMTLDHQGLRGRPGKVNVLYHQSYALVTWICRERKLQLAEYLRRLNGLPPGRPSAETHLKVVEAAFGDIDRLEKIWLRHENAR